MNSSKSPGTLPLLALLPMLILSACGGGESSDAATASASVGTPDAAASPGAAHALASTAVGGDDARILAVRATAEPVSLEPDSDVVTLAALSPSLDTTASVLSVPATLPLLKKSGSSAQREAVDVTASGSSLSADAVAAIAVTGFTGRGRYVDAIGGSDMNAGTQAAPWKTLAKASTAALAAGDAILLKCGATWRESLQIGGKTSPLADVTLGIYGTCTTANRPVVTGADPIQGVTWTLASQFGGKPVYAAKWSQPVSQLFWNNALMTQARHPNYGGIGAEFNLVKQAKTATTFVLNTADMAMMSTTDLAGATVHLRTEPWKTEKAKVLSYNKSDGTVTLSTTTRSLANTGEGYFLEGHQALLDAPGEWFLDTTTGTLYVYVPSGLSPATGVLETVQRSVGVSLRNTTDARVENLQLDRQATRSLELIDAPRTVVTDVTSTASGNTGIHVDRLNLATGSKGTRIVRASVNAAASTGIQINHSAETTVSSSAVLSTGIVGQPGSIGVGIAISDSNTSVLQSNTVAKSASSAINLGRISGVSVVGNTITQACMRFTDCGAVYAWGAPGGAPRSTIQSNRITDMIPNAQGASGGAPTLVAGVYFDIDSGSSDVIGNMISNVGVGLMMLDASNNRFASNHVWLVDSASTRIHSSNTTVDKVRGNVIEANILYGANTVKPSSVNAATFVNSAVYVQQWIHHSNANAMFTGANPNIVRSNTTGSVTAKSSLLWQLVSGQTGVALDSKQWVAISAGEQQQQAFEVNLVLPTYVGTNLILNGAMSTPATPWSYWAAPSSIGGSATFGTCTGGCAVFTAGSERDTLSSGVLSMSSSLGDNLYMLRFKAQSLTGSPARPTVQIARNGGDWSSLGLNKWVTVAADTETVSESLFIVTASFQGKLSFVAPASSVLRIREVSLQKVASYELLAPATETVLLANETAVQKVVDCANSGLRTCVAKQLNGQSVVWPIIIPSHSALPIVAADGKWLRSQ